MAIRKRSLLDHYLHFLIRFNVPIIIFFFALVLLAIIPAARIQFKSTFQDLLPPKAESVKNLMDLSRIYGGEGFLLLLLKGRPLDEMIKFADELAPDLEKLDSVSHVSYKVEPGFFLTNALLYMDLADLQQIESRLNKKIAYEKKKRNPFLIKLEDERDDFTLSDIIQKYGTNRFRSSMSTPDGKILVLLVKPTGAATDVDFLNRLIAGTEAVVAAHQAMPGGEGIQVIKQGRYYLTYNDNKTLENDLLRLTLISIALIILVLYFFFRGIKSLLLISIPLASGVILNFALTYFTIGHLNMLSGFLTGILLGLGLEIGIYLLSRYFEEKHRHVWLLALRNCLKQTGAAATFAASTTSVAFYSLVFSGFRGFSEFGLIAGNGMVLTSFCMLTFFPSLIIFLERRKGVRLLRLTPPPGQHRDSYKKTPYLWLQRHRVGVRLGFAGVLVATLVGLSFLSFDFDFSHLSNKSIVVCPELDQVERELDLTLNPTIIMVTNQAMARDIAATVNRRVKDGSLPTIMAATSVMDFVPPDQEAKLAILHRLKSTYNEYRAAINAMPQGNEIRQVLPALDATGVRLEDVPEVLRREFVSADGKWLFVSVRPKVSTDDGSQLERLIRDIRSVRYPGGEVKAAGSSFIFGEIVGIIYGKGPRILALTYFLVLVIVILLFRKVKDVLVIMGAITVSMLVGAALATALQLPFNYLNVIVLPILFGMGVDNSIHIIYRLRRTRDSLPRMMHHISQAVLASSVTNMLGFSVLIWANFRGLMSIGLLATYGMVAVILVSLVFLPAFLPLFYKVRTTEGELETSHPLRLPEIPKAG
ncbi:MAG: MMPL family transporter [Spirochaetes bacterium]|nr:MMPL family transporter [Spirochaetota bacterium]